MLALVCACVCTRARAWDDDDDARKAKLVTKNERNIPPFLPVFEPSRRHFKGPFRHLGGAPVAVASFGGKMCAAQVPRLNVQSRNVTNTHFPPLHTDLPGPKFLRRSSAAPLDPPQLLHP